MAIVASVATGVIKPLVCKLSKLLEEESARLKGVRRNIGFIRDELSTMGATLQILADTEDLDPEMRIWRDGIRELSYDMEDCVDDFMARVDHDDPPTGIKGFFDKLKKLKPRHEIAGEIEKLKARAMEMSDRHQRYKIDRTPLGDSSIDPRLHALYVEVDKLVGIKGPKEDIIKWFEEKASSTELRVLSIVGPGGLGKTTLANQVYHAIKSQFPCAAFISVSRKPDMKNVLRNIAETVRVSQPTSNDDEKLLIDRLRDHLRDKRYFIVVDDVWDIEALETIKNALPNNNLGSRIITTTRNNAVASCCSSQQDDYVYTMKPLSFTNSKRLLLKRAFHCEDSFHPHLEKVSKEILEKCAGLPLAIITISSLLADQYAIDEWNRVLSAIGSGLSNDPNAENMRKILYLSYIDLPHHLRTCLLYLSIFPEDCRIEKHRLISRWIAEGFIHEEQGRSTYEVGERYFNDLINRCLIQPAYENYGEAEACQVHDIVLDFITCKATEENFATSFDGTNHGFNSDYSVRRLSLKHPRKITIPTRLILSHVRSLTVFGNSRQDPLMNFPSLRVLDLGGCYNLEENVVADIENMFLLKYLSLGVRITMLPRQLEALQYIETLDIKATKITELPSTITRLQRLARLYVNNKTRFPDGIIGQMRSLEELSEFGVFSCEIALHLQQFAQLTTLRRLTVRICVAYWELEGRQLEDFNSYVGTLISSRSLHHLYFTGMEKRTNTYYPVSLESWCPITPCSLRKLRVTGFFSLHVPNCMSSLGNLTTLSLNIFCMRPVDISVLGTMPTLIHLGLYTVCGSNGRILIRGFTCLKSFTLAVSRCGTAVEFEAGSMQKVEHLRMIFPLHSIKCVNGLCDFGIWHLPSLTNIEIAVESNGEGVAHGEARRIVEGVVGALSISPSIVIFSGRECEHFEHVLMRKYLDDNGSLPEGIEIHDIEATRGDMVRIKELKEQMLRIKQLKREEEWGVKGKKKGFASTRAPPPDSLLGAQDPDSIQNSEQDDTDKSVDNRGRGLIKAMVSGSTDTSEPVVARPFFAAVRPAATAMLVPPLDDVHLANCKSTSHKSHVCATSNNRGQGHHAKAALQPPLRLDAAQDPLVLTEAMSSSVHPSSP